MKIAFLPYLPRKKNTIIIFLVAIFVVGGIAYFSLSKENKIEKIVGQIVSDKAFFKDLKENSENLDSDNDGLKDWEEILWKTDPRNADTDGDGYNDGEEVVGGYDPVDPTSNPKTTKKKESSKQFDEIKIPEYLNLTKQLARNIGAQIISQGEMDTSAFSDPMSMIDQNTSQGMVEFIASLNIQLPDSYFKTTSDNSAESFKKYTGEIQKIISESGYSFDPNTKTDIEKSLEKGNLSVLDDYINIYDITFTQLKNVTVPSSFLPTHKNLAELIIGTRKSFEAVRRMQDDPLMAIMGITQAQENINKLQELMPIFSDLFQKYQ